MAKIIKAYTPITSGFQDKDEIGVPMLIDEYIDKVGTGLVGPYICVINENPISRQHWGSLVIQKNDVVLFLAFPQGPEEGGSSPVKAIATIALMAAAMTIPGMAFFAGGMFAAGTFGGALMSGTIMFGGSYLLNLAFPPQPPEQVTESIARSGTSLSSYNINDRGNNSALVNVITVQYGRIKHYPKYAMQSWSEFIDNEQYAYLLFCQGQGEYDFEEYNFGTASSDELSDVIIETYANNATIQIDGGDFYDNVFTSDQVQNIEVKRLDFYEVEVPGSVIPTYTVEIGDDAWVGLNTTYSKRGIWGTSIPAYTIADEVILTNTGIGDGAFDVIGYEAVENFSELDPGPSVGAQQLAVGTEISSVYPVTGAKFKFINSTVGTIPFTNGVYGNELIYDGFIAGDRIFIVDLETSYIEDFIIKSSFYDNIDGVDIVAYEFLETVPDGREFTKSAEMKFIPGDAANGYIVPNNNSEIQKASVDISFPNGLYQVNETTGDIESTEVEFRIQYKEIPASGIEPFSWANTGVISVSAGVKTPILQTYDIPITSSVTQKIRVRVNRIYGTAAEYAAQNKAVSTMIFNGLKAFLPDTSNYGNVTMIPVKVKTTDSLVQATLSQFNTVSTRKLPIYTTSWSAVTATRNPAWAIADACRNSEYSLGIPDEDIDIDELVTLAATWESRGDYCDGLFENKEVFWDALRKICKVGRAQPLMITGAVGFVRDQPKTIPVQVFTSDNISMGSFNVDYIPFDNDTPNSVEMEYFDEDEWLWKKTLQTIPGGDTTEPASLQIWGITTEAQAIRDAKYESACNAYRRKLPNFTTELEGRILKRLDYISVSSPRVGWGTSGHIVNVDGNELELSGPVEFTSGSHYIAFRKKNGSQDGPYLVTQVTDEPKKVLMSTTPPAFIYTDYEYEKTYFQFGQGDSYDKKALVSTVQFNQLESSQITCIIDDDRVYTADGTTGA